ncbi:MAG: hypothetical protein JST68_27210 [Bacteroidetes bacterium]|nr:hypothetical protein [Bacteroidota bacterium]
MKLRDNTTCGLIAWGTKQGVEEFFACNFLEKETRRDYGLYDIRLSFQFSGPKFSFYCIEHFPDYSRITIYRTIIDWVGRAGFYAMTIVIPAGLTFRENNNIGELLSVLSDNYWSRYIASGPRPNMIDHEVIEDSQLFAAIIDDNKYRLIANEEDPRSSDGEEVCIVRYKDETALSAIFENYEGEEFFKYKRVFLLPTETPTITSKLSEVSLTPSPKYYFKIVALEESSGDYLFNIYYSCIRNGQQVLKNECSYEGDYNIKTGITRRDQLKITLEKTGYHQKDIDQDYLFNKLHSGITSREHPEKVPVLLKKKQTDQEQQQSSGGNSSEKKTGGIMAWFRGLNTAPKAAICTLLFFGTIALASLIITNTSGSGKNKEDKKDTTHNGQQQGKKNQQEIKPIAPQDLEFIEDSTAMARVLNDYKNRLIHYDDATELLVKIKNQWGDEGDKEKYQAYIKQFNFFKSQIENIYQQRLAEIAKSNKDNKDNNKGNQNSGSNHNTTSPGNATTEQGRLNEINALFNLVKNSQKKDEVRKALTVIKSLKTQLKKPHREVDDEIQILNVKLEALP